jgi:UDP-N-acetylmuramyl pentapeptide phosphotransferase/UDP-N-acetylglucosamine-1-phosphate transferase
LFVLLSVGCAFGISCLLSRFFSRPDARLQILDYPNERSLHEIPTPRTGGLAIWIGSAAGVGMAVGAFGTSSRLGLIGVAALVVGLVSIVDDRSHVPVWSRLLAHAFAAGLLLAAGLGLRSIGFLNTTHALSGVIEPLLTVLFVVWLINLYNFMDGMDGFAGGMAVFGFGTLGLLGILAGDGYFAAVSWAIAAAAGGFLVWNFPPARIFMGDTGSSVLGLMAAALSLWGDGRGLFPLWLAILVFSPFVVDATVTLIRRAARGERVWEAHRSHYYQRLVRLGWGHRRTVVLEYALMAGCSVTAIVLLKASPTAQWMGLSAWALIYVIGMYAVARLEAAR